MMKSMLKIGNRSIAVEHPDGTELQMEGNVLSAKASTRSLEFQLKEELGKQGIQWGDALAWATHKLGIEQCAACKKRQAIMNQASRLGIAETTRQIVRSIRGGR